MNAEQFRRLACSMPEAVEKSHMAHPDFRVGERIFATLWTDGVHAVLRLGPETRAMLVDAKPGVFSIPRGGERGGWTLVQLPGASVGEMRALVTEAWSGVAPKKLVASLSAPAKPSAGREEAARGTSSSRRKKPLPRSRGARGRSRG